MSAIVLIIWTFMARGIADVGREGGRSAWRRGSISMSIEPPSPSKSIFSPQ